MLRSLLIFTSGFLLGFLLAYLFRPRFQYPVVDTGNASGDMWPPNVTWSYAPPNPGTWGRIC